MREYILCCCIIGFCSQLNAQRGIEISYPETKKVIQTDVYHGVKVDDPYRWLEDESSPEVKAWIESQNKVTFGYLGSIPFRKQIRERMDELVNYPRMSAPNKVGQYYFYTKNTGLQNQDVIYRRDGLEGQEVVFIDPNKINSEGTTSIGIAGVSRDDKYLVLSVSEAGSDWRKMIVYDVTTMKSIGDTLKWIKFSGAAWDDNGFYYSRYPAPEAGSAYSAGNRFHSIFYHKIGEPQEMDALVFEDKEHPGRYHSLDVTEDGKYELLYVSEGTDGFECYYRSGESEANSNFTPLFTGFSNKSSVVDHDNGKFIVRTDISAPKYRLVSVDPNSPSAENWHEIISEKDHLLQSVSTSGGYLFARYLENASSKVYQFRYDGEKIREIEFPYQVSAYGFNGKREDKETFYSYSSFIQPGAIYRYEFESGVSEVYYKPELPFNPDDYESSQVSYPAKDGELITMFLVHKKGLKPDGSNPCLLYGYGGFNISLTPGFSSSRIPWLENGGIFAMPNLRGGGEYGEEWHRAGMLQNKQNVFNDFIAAAEFLLAKGYTSSEKLVISGRSNGGLLVGAVMTQRPDLFKVALPGVGVMDMLRYHTFTVGHGWIPEFGSSESEADFKNLYSYSPLHNLKKGVKYPATLIHTADHDDRVVPAHSFKFAATIQEKHRGENPVLIRIETNAGHGGGKPISKALDEEADKLAFSFFNIGVTPYKD